VLPLRRIETSSAPGSLGWNRALGTLALLSFAMLIVSLDQYVVVVALPDIARDLGYSAQTLQSVISAYAVASAGFLLFGGRAADLLGRRHILITGLGLYTSAFHNLAVKCRVWTVKSAFDLGESGLRRPDETHVERHFSRERLYRMVQGFDRHC
jgi:hypothetical protein